MVMHESPRRDCHRSPPAIAPRGSEQAPKRPLRGSHDCRRRTAPVRRVDADVPDIAGVSVDPASQAPLTIRPQPTPLLTFTTA